jgi:hypothetical protein
MTKEYTTYMCKYVFTGKEKTEIAQEMAQSVSEKEQAEKDKKSVMIDFNSQIEGLAAKVNNSATKLNNGYEMRSIKCEIEMDFSNRVVRYIRTDNYETAKERTMTSDELQMQIEDAEAA